MDKVEAEMRATRYFRFRVRPEACQEFRLELWMPLLGATNARVWRGWREGTLMLCDWDFRPHTGFVVFCHRLRGWPYRGCASFTVLDELIEDWPLPRRHV